MDKENASDHEALSRIQKTRQSKSIDLNLSGLSLTKIPLEIAKLTHITELDCSRNLPLPL
jgi:Leucine-rich repeat (LRR) protein